MSMCNHLRNLLGRFFKLLETLGIVSKPSIMGGGDIPMVSLPCLFAEMASEYFQRCQHIKSLCSSYGTNFLSLLYCVVSGVLLVRASGKLSSYCWM